MLKICSSKPCKTTCIQARPTKRIHGETPERCDRLLPVKAVGLSAVAPSVEPVGFLWRTVSIPQTTFRDIDMIASMR